MDSDEEDFVFYGTPIEREDDVTTSRKKKSVAEASGQLRTLAPWKQEVRDEEGRRRFHGAFSGGFSAGYYNTVGSKEGWTPQTFVSSRKNRAEVKQQDILNFLDDDEKADLEGLSLGTSSQFDTFGFTAADLARKHAENEQQKRPSAIPGPVPDELVLPASDSIGVKLLLKMGWRHGRSIKDSSANVAYDARREARKAFLAFSSSDVKTLPDPGSVHGEPENYIEQPASDDVQSSQNTPVYVLYPKQDLHGLGFDPFKHAPEFREKKRSRLSEDRGLGNISARVMNNNLFGFKSGKIAPGFGIGALEEFDAEDEDVYASGYDFEETYIEDTDEPTKLIMDSKQKSVRKETGALSGFRLSSKSDYQLERFDPPIVPTDFVPHHKFSGPPETGYKLGDPGPQEVPPPPDNNLKVLIDGVAALVARCGKLFEDLSREKNQSNPLFSFLVGGDGHNYYARKLWEEQQKRGDQTKLQLDGKPKTAKMTAESRGKVLGERPLERSSKDSNSSTASTASADAIKLQYNLSDTFADPSLYSEMPVVAKPFINDPAKQERFEQFLKEKYQGGLRSTQSGRASHMSETARARERLDFEAAAEAIKKGKWSKEISTILTGGMEFTSGGLVQAKDTRAEDAVPKEVHVKRIEYQWRPSAILCKRFDLTDPFMGKPPPAPRMKSKMEDLIFTSDSVKANKEEETIIVRRVSYHMPEPEAQEISKDVPNNENGGEEVEVENVERPVDLYKAIFSDDSDDEEDTTIPNEVGNPEKKVEAANTTLNRLIAGDFLESLGKELGLEVPPELPSSTNKAMNAAPPKETANGNANSRIHNLFPVEDWPSSTLDVPRNREIAQDTTSERKEPVNGNLMGNSARSNSKYAESASLGHQLDKYSSDKGPLEDTKFKTPSRRHRSLNRSSSSEDEKSKRRSRRHRHRHSDSDSDSSINHQDRYRSRSKGNKKGSSREKSSSSSRRHSKHHKRRSRDSPSYSPEKDRTETKTDKYRRRD